MITRRDAIKRIGGLAGMAALPKFLSACGGDDGPVGITNYVYLMLENRTYDHVFGARKLQGMAGDGLVMGMSNPDMNGVAVPIYEAPKEQLCVEDPPHGWDESHRQWNAGANDGFVTEQQAAHSNVSGHDPMQYLTRTQIPISWALADNYTTCDRWFASVMGPTIPNRAYWHLASSFGIDDNMAVITEFASLPAPSIFNRLHDKNIDWVYYYSSFSIVSIFQGAEGPYKLDLGPPPNEGTGHIRRFGEASDRVGQFFKDAAAGTLPPVTYIEPYFGGGGNDDHPPTHPIMAQSLIAAVYLALAKSPQWKNTMLLITYDEHGGFFDHVPPPTNPDDDTLAKYGIDGFQQMGFRVPAIVIGPYAKQNYVSSVQYDHTSALKHLQTAFGLEPLNARMNNANDLSDCIDMDRLARGDWAKPIELPMIDVDAWPMDPLCTSGGPFRTNDFVEEWADANKDKLNAPDLRGERDSLMETIREFLRTNQGTLK